jgi:hypothetical protein
MVRLSLIFVITSFLLFGCKYILKDDKLSLGKTFIDSSILQLDGYFFRPYGKENKCTIVLLYKDGTFCDWDAGVDVSNLLSLEKDFLENSKLSKRKGLKFSWGIVSIKDSTIKLERWYASEPPLRSYLKSGKISNDSTFVLTSSTRSDGSDRETINETYHFRKFAPKPDSTNKFVN